MVISTTINGTTIYLHAAYATDNHGSGFSLSEFSGALYVGNYSDQSATESNDWRSYTWKLIGNEVVDSDDIEAYEDLEPSEITDVEDSINEINETTDDVETRTLNNNDNLQLTQNDVNQGIGNLNLLSGTNQGAQNWTSGSSTLSDYSTAIYNDDDVVNAMHAVIVSGSDTLEFDANSLNDFISNNAEINTFTLSYDMNVSNASGTFTVESSGVLNFDAPDFTTDDPLEDFAGAWVHFISTTELTSGTPTETVLKFIYSGSANDTIDIANLKIEAGADATPWRASLAEVESTANTALSTANTAASDAAMALAAAQSVNNYFWHDSSGAHVTQVTQTQYQGDPANAGGNTLITSSGLNVLDGTTTLASFGSTGAQVGQSGSEHILINSSGFSVYDNTQEAVTIQAYTSGGISGTDIYSGDNYIKTETDSNYSELILAAGERNKNSRIGRVYLVATGQQGGEHTVSAGVDTQTGMYDFFVVHNANNTPVILFGVTEAGAGRLEDTLTVGRDPTSDLEVATKKYVDDNSGGGGFDGTATIIKTSATLSNSATDYTLSDNISNYKFLTFSFSNNTNFGRWTVPVSVFKLSTTSVENVVTRGGSTTRYAYVKYVNDTKINVYCSVNNGLNMIVYGIK